MDNHLIFKFKTDISEILIDTELNNPFGEYVPKIGKLAAKEFQEFIAEESKKWNYDFEIRRGKMFGLLVIQQKDKSYGYLGTVSGKLPNNNSCAQFVPTILDETAGDAWFNSGMKELTSIGNQIKASAIQEEISLLKAKRTQKSIGLQRRLFESYHFLNLSGEKLNLLDIFENSTHGNPPAAAGDCAAPKLLQYAIKHHLKPIALTEFWWGSSELDVEKEHRAFYPACKHRCRPILEYMLEDPELFNSGAKNWVDLNRKK
jgi:tRNA pseudouridine32 synthase/23S rRNA pseudouridine746 synthase